MGLLRDCTTSPINRLQCVDLGLGTGMRRVWKLLAAVTWKCLLTQVTQYSSGLSPLHSGGSWSPQLLLRVSDKKTQEQ